MRIPSAARRLTALVSLALAPSLASAHDVDAGPLLVRHPWARATPGGARVGGGYLTIENRGKTPDRLTGGSFAASDAFELHSMSMDGGVMRMRPTGPLEIPAGGSVTLDPEGLHIMFNGLRRGLKQGETIPGTLVCEHAGTVPVEFEVEGIGAKGPGATIHGPGAGGMGAAPDHPGSAMPGMGMD
jgi:hypothetical protein